MKIDERVALIRSNVTQLSEANLKASENYQAWDNWHNGSGWGGDFSNSGGNPPYKCPSETKEN